MPASNDHLATWSGTEEHLLDTLLPYKVRQDTEGVHAHACKSGGSWSPKLFVWTINFFQENLVKLDSISKLKSDFAVLQLSKVLMNLVGEVDHLLTDLNTNNHVVVVDNLSLKLSSSHANLDESNFSIILFDFGEGFLEESDLISEKLTHDGVLGGIGVNSITPYERRDLFPDGVTIILFLLLVRIVAAGLGVNLSLGGRFDI